MKILNGKLQTIKNEQAKIRKELRNKISGYVVGAFGLVAALAWNDAIKALIDYFFPQSDNTLVAKFVYAAIITIVVALVGVYVVRFLTDKEEPKS